MYAMQATHATPLSPAADAPAPAVRSFVHWVTDPVAAHVPQVRARVRTVLDGWRISVDESDSLLLALSELVGNVVRHVGAGRMRVALTSGGGWLRLEVADQGAGLPRLPSPRAEGDPEAEAGRGLLIVQLLAADLGGELTVVAAEFGKAVRLRIPVGQAPRIEQC
ncbi:ATP-binding protein [Streptomyces sp. NBC_01351]|uniref:ATP-binding protein n=1 Tax=Streptomyces sp. NBC_01351 TaxID=2903833 RepID=UPI002E2EF5EE|nr:ATP-binding protein [Streptomyces sp. NBC_01351]